VFGFQDTPNDEPSLEVVFPCVVVFLLSLDRVPHVIDMWCGSQSTELSKIGCQSTGGSAKTNFNHLNHVLLSSARNAISETNKNEDEDGSDGDEGGC
jgi:hypothetical protein